MATIASGFNKRGHKALYEGNYAAAVDCFFRAYRTEPENDAQIMDLIYALNQNADYICALKYCYSLLGKGTVKNPDMLYFFTAEAFGGVGCIEGCAQMLERSLNISPNGAASQEARAFLDDLRQKYEIGKYDAASDEVDLGVTSGMTDVPFYNTESYNCVNEVSAFANTGDFASARETLEKEFSEGNFTVSLLNAGLLLGDEMRDRNYMKLCAERFKFVEDYTLTELRALAYNLNETGDDDIAYTVYRELYGKESGDKNVAFGFAVSCARLGDTQHAFSILSEITSATGGIGPAAYRDDIYTHSYMYRFEGDREDMITDKIRSQKALDRTELAEIFEYLHFAEGQTVSTFMGMLDLNDAYIETELRCLAIEPDVTIFTRVEAAGRLFRNGKNNVFLNAGSDIVKFTPQMENIINKFFERIKQ